MFDPIKASKDIKKSYIDYITTTFDMADPQYKQEFLEELKKEGMIAKGPFLDIGGSFEVGHTLQEHLPLFLMAPFLSVIRMNSFSSTKRLPFVMHCAGTSMQMR